MHYLTKTYQLIAVLLAALMFVTSIVVTIDMHVCSGHIKSVSLFGKAKNCFELAQVAKHSKCAKHQTAAATTGCEEDQQLQKKKCCEDMQFEFKADIDQQVSVAELLLTPDFQQFVISFAFIFSYNHPTSLLDNFSFLHYLSPLISRDIPVLFQAFLL